MYKAINTEDPQDTLKTDESFIVRCGGGEEYRGAVPTIKWGFCVAKSNKTKAVE
jgi:hypothetical protein